jgi:hypothetical protein
MSLPQRPIIYEINTWVWLHEIGWGLGRPVTLESVPDAEWDALAATGADTVWLMGVWERSPAGIAVSMRNEALVASFHQALPDFTAPDNVGSPYCIRRYEVDPRLGGAAGLAAARARLSRRGMGLVLDFVPNHVAPDHPWVSDRPEYFIQGAPSDLAADRDAFLDVNGRVFACGRDPYFPAWPDVLQVNAFDPGLRQAAVDALLKIAECCDGVRCDMAMLMLNAVFERTWGARAGVRPETDYWRTIIPAVKDRHPAFRFIAEAYWDLEWELQQQGFDFCYDKRLYDRLEHGGAEPVRLHLLADPDYQRKLLRFIENHDEPRAAAVFEGDRLRAVAVAALTLPGAKLFHEGQLEGRRVKLPVFLGRRPSEPADEGLKEFHRRLLKVVSGDVLRSGDWQLCACSGWPENPSWQGLVAWCWRQAGECCLVVVNLAEGAAQGRVRLPWDDLRGRGVSLADAFSGAVYDRTGDEMVEPGLYVDLPGWGHHVFTFGLPAPAAS